MEILCLHVSPQVLRFEVSPFVATEMDLETITLSRISQNHTFSLVCGI